MGDTPINQAPSGVPEGITLAPIQVPTAAPAAAAPEGVPEGITLSAIPPATAAAPPKQSLTDIAKAALTNPATIVGPTTALGAPTTSQENQEGSGTSELLHGQIAKGLHDIWSAEAPHVIQGSPIEKVIQAFKPDFHGSLTPDDAAAGRTATMAPIENAPVDVAQYIDKQQHPVLKAATEIGQSVLSPANVSIMIATGGLGMVDNPVALSVANRLISAGFGAQAAAQMYKHSERFKEAYDRGDASEALYQLTHAVGSGVVSYLAGNHAASGEQLPIASQFDKNVATGISSGAANILNKLNSVVPNPTGGTPADHLATAEDLLYKAAPPTKGQAAEGYRDRLHTAMPQIQEIANNNPNIDSPVAMADAIDQHIKAQEASIRNRARQLGDDPTAQVNGLEAAVDRAMAVVRKNKVGGFDPAEADRAEDAIRNSLRAGPGNTPRELSLEEAENLRQTWNEQVAKANGPMSQTAPGIADSLKDAAVKAMRDQLDSHYAKVGVNGIQEWRAQEAPLIDVKDTLYDAAKKSIDAGKWNVMKAISKQKGWGLLPILYGGIAGGPLGALGGLLGDVGLDWLNNRRTNPNDLTQRAHEQLQNQGPSGAALPQVNPGPPTPTPGQAVAASVTPQGPVAPAAPAAAAPQAAVTPAASATPQVAVVGRVATPAEAAAMQAGEGVEITHSGDANGPNEVKLKVDGDDKGYLVFNHNGSTASIVSTQIFDKADQGLGYGQQMLNEAALKAKMQGSKALTSDENGDMTDAAKRPWEALIRKGQPVERITLPNGKPGYSWDLTKIDAEGKPIPEEEEKTEVPKAKPAKAEANKGGDERAAAQPVVPPGPPPASNPHTAAPVAAPTPPATGPLNYAAAAARGVANPTPTGQEQKPEPAAIPANVTLAPIAQQSVTHSKEDLQQIVRQAATAHGVPPELLDAQADQESKYNVHAVSPKGARGLMQFMPATAKAVGLQNPENPEEAADRGAELMAQLHKRFGRWDQALAGYNTSPDNVQNAIDSYGDEWLYHLPQETQNYVHTIMGHYVRGAHVPTMPGNTAHPKRANAAMQLVTPNAS